MRLDRDDRAALARLGVYVSLGASVVLLIVLVVLVGALVAGLAVKLFCWVA